MSQQFFNKSKVRFFEGVNLLKIEESVNEFMATQARIYGVKHSALVEEGMHYHYVMVSYE